MTGQTCHVPGPPGIDVSPCQPSRMAATRRVNSPAPVCGAERECMEQGSSLAGTLNARAPENSPPSRKTKTETTHHVRGLD